MCDLNVERDIDIRWTTARIVLTFQFRCMLVHWNAYLNSMVHICIASYACTCGNVNLVLQIVLQLGRSISIVWHRTCIRMCNRNWVKLIAQKPLANEMTFVCVHIALGVHKQRTSFYVVFICFFIVLIAVVIFYSIGIISRIRLNHFMGIEVFFLSLLLYFKWKRKCK